MIAKLVQEALLEEVYTTPKPGLVDCHDTGAHTDMDCRTFEKKAPLPLRPTSPPCTSWADAGGARRKRFSAPCARWDCKPSKPCWLPPTA